MRSVRAVVLAGGYGTRMRPLTDRRPKHLLPIGDEPVIAHQLRRLAAAGVKDVTLATSYHAEAFEPVLRRGERYGLQLRYVREETPLGTAGALRHALAEPGLADDDAIVVLNGDLITEHDMAAHIDRHRRARYDDEGVLATIHGRPVADAGAYGLLHLDSPEHQDAGSESSLPHVGRFEEKPAHRPAGVVNAGTYVISADLLDLIPEGEVVSLERETFVAACARDGVRAFVEDAPFHDIGTPHALLEANLTWSGGSPVVLSTCVEPSADISRSLVMPGAVIGEGAHVADSVVGPGAQIGPHAHLQGCVVGDDAFVGAWSSLEARVVQVGQRLENTPCGES